jgi:hypothetical protein
MLFQLQLTQLQQSALVGILVEHLLQPTTTREWIMVTTNEQTTIEDLIDLVSHAEPIHTIETYPTIDHRHN